MRRRITSEDATGPSGPSGLLDRDLIGHEADVPVLLSAIQAKPDWLLTRNTKHFTPQVAKRTGLQIGSPADFFRLLSQGIS